MSPRPGSARLCALALCWPRLALIDSVIVPMLLEELPGCVRNIPESIWAEMNPPIPPAHHDEHIVRTHQLQQRCNLPPRRRLAVIVIIAHLHVTLRVPEAVGLDVVGGACDASVLE